VSGTLSRSSLSGKPLFCVCPSFVARLQPIRTTTGVSARKSSEAERRHKALDFFGISVEIRAQLTQSSLESLFAGKVRQTERDWERI
jgi:hypothetical protein